MECLLLCSVLRKHKEIRKQHSVLKIFIATWGKENVINSKTPSIVKLKNIRLQKHVC